MTWEMVPETQVTERRFPWWIVLAVGILVILVGLGLLVWPFTAASWLLVILFGSALIANGLAVMIRARPVGLSVVAGLLLIAAGVLAMVFVDLTVGALVAFVAVTLIIVGALWLVLGIGFGGARRPLVLLPGVLALAGGVAALIWPAVALTVAAIVGGLLTVLIGSFIVWGATRLRGVRIETARTGF